MLYSSRLQSFVDKCFCNPWVHFVRRIQQINENFRFRRAPICKIRNLILVADNCPGIPIFVKNGILLEFLRERSAMVTRLNNTGMLEYVATLNCSSTIIDVFRLSYFSENSHSHNSLMVFKPFPNGVGPYDRIPRSISS